MCAVSTPATRRMPRIDFAAADARAFACSGGLEIRSMPELEGR
jgi:hypothetical protein